METPIRIQSNSHTPIYRQIVEQVVAHVVGGRLRPGERLPSVRQMADELLVNPNTVARAYRELDREGLVTTRSGDGVFIADQGSPFRARQRRRLVLERIDALVAAAEQVNMEASELVDLVRARVGQRRAVKPGSGRR